MWPLLLLIFQIANSCAQGQQRPITACLRETTQGRKLPRIVTGGKPSRRHQIDRELFKAIKFDRTIHNSHFSCTETGNMEEGAFLEDTVRLIKRNGGGHCEFKCVKGPPIKANRKTTTVITTTSANNELTSSTLPTSTPMQPIPESDGKFLLFTDFHVNLKYFGDGNSEFGDRNNDPPMALVDYMLGQGRKQLAKPDFIVWTGDTPAHVEYTKDELLETMQKGTDAFKKFFAGTLVIPVLGNHDMRSLTDESSPILRRATHIGDKPEELGLYEQIFYMWKEWIGHGAKETFLRGGYYRFKAHLLPNGPTEFLVLNTNIYYTSNTATFVDRTDPTGQFAWMAEELADVRSNNGTIHILAHVPPGVYERDSSQGTTTLPEMPEEYNQQFLALLVEYAASIGLMLFGHLHTDTFRIVKSGAGEPVQRLFLNPAVTPIFELNNPAFRIYDYKKSNFELMDIRTYYVNLDQLNKEGDVKIDAQLGYSMRQAYMLPSLDPRALNDLVERMGTDKELFKEYSQRRTVMYDSKSNPNR